MNTDVRWVDIPESARGDIARHLLYLLSSHESDSRRFEKELAELERDAQKLRERRDAANAGVVTIFATLKLLGIDVNKMAKAT